MPIELIGDPSATEKLAAGVIDPAFAILIAQVLGEEAAAIEPYDAIAWEVPSTSTSTDETVPGTSGGSPAGTAAPSSHGLQGPIKKIGPAADGGGRDHGRVQAHREAARWRAGDDGGHPDQIEICPNRTSAQ